MNNLTQCWIHVTSGQGPDECALAVFNLARFIIKEAKQLNLIPELIEATPGNKPDTYASALIRVRGDNLEGFINRWKGAVQWICESPFRPTHKRKNWFVGVDILSPSLIGQTHVNERDVVFEAMRASGPGGQHVNTTDSAVRATHIPTGMIAAAREERSQHMNKKLALARLTSQLEEKNRETMASNIQEKWSKHKQLERGNPVRVFVGKEFKEKVMS